MRRAAITAIVLVNAAFYLWFALEAAQGAFVIANVYIATFLLLAAGVDEW